MTRTCVALLMITAALPACTPEPPLPTEERPSIESDKKAIEALRQKELLAFNSGDVKGLVSIVTDDVVFDSPNRRAAIGKDAVRTLCEAVFERFNYDATYPTDELVVDRNLAFDRGIWIENRTLKEGGDQSQMSFGMLQIYQRQVDGSWKLARSIWNLK